jgi:hypothetical protein
MCLKPLFGMESLDLPATSNVAVKKREAPSCCPSGMLKCPDNHEHNLTKLRTSKVVTIVKNDLPFQEYE